MKQETKVKETGKRQLGQEEIPMKHRKKIVACALAGVLALTPSAVFADVIGGADVLSEIVISEPGVVTPSVVRLNGFNDQESWAADTDAAVYSKKKVDFEKKQSQMLTYTAAKFDSEVLQFRYSVDFNDGANWGGFSLRGQQKNVVAWSGNYSYLIVVKQSQIELQRFSSTGNKFFAVVPNNGIIKSNQEYEITLGSVKVAGGVQNFLYVDGALVLNCFDGDDDAITSPGYLSFYSGTKMTVGAAESSDELADIPAGFSISGSAETGSLTADYSMIRLGKDEDGELTVRWGRNNEPYGELSDAEMTGLSDFKGKYAPVGQYPLVENAEGSVYSLTDADKNRYIAAYLTDSDGQVLANSEAFYYDTVSTEKEKMLILLTDCEYSLVYNDKVQIDPDDPWICPTVENGVTFVPIRFIAENLGANVSWDAETGIVILAKDGVSVRMQIGSRTYTVNGEAKELETESFLYRDRTMVPLRMISESFGKSVFWNEEGLIIISDSEPVWDTENDSDVFNEIIQTLQVFG